VRLWQWDDVLFTDGATLALGALFFAVGVTSFALHPYATGSWALLALCSTLGGLFSTLFLLIRPTDVGKALYFHAALGLASVVPVHLGLAFPVVHPLLARRPRILLLVYGIGAAIAAYEFRGWATDWAIPFQYAGQLNTTAILLAIGFATGRCGVLALRARDPLVAQRARILLAGELVGAGPPAVANFLRNTLGILLLDYRLSLWTLSLFLLALYHVTVREDLLNARIAVRRAVIYAGVVAVLTFAAVALITFRPYAVAALLLPLLYVWPQFDARLNSWLYPERARFPEILRELGDELVTCDAVEAVLDVLAHAPARVCGAARSAALLFASAASSERVRTAGGWEVAAGRPFAAEPLLQVLIATRAEIARSHVAVQPQYANIRTECYAGFDRLGAEVVLPIVRDGLAVGALAVGPRLRNDIYEPTDIHALSAVAQQAVQAIARVEAMERLQARELEFADLKRFFPPQIIDQVMAKGGAAELRSQRKLVTVFFSDLRGFTSFSDSVEPEEVMATLAEYHAAMGRRVAELAGTLERFAGDGLMVFFNDPIEQADHVERAVRMAIVMQRDVRRLRAEWARKGYRVDVGMGIHTGYGTCGFIGYEGRRDYGVIGNVTNLAARLSDAAAGGEILISARVRAELPATYAAEPVGELTLKGFHQPQVAYRLVHGGPG